MPEFAWVPSYDSDMDASIRTQESKFEGYRQVVPDGLNTFEDSWNLVFNVSPDVADSIVAFLKGKSGTPFTSVLPRGAEGTVTCKSVKRSFVDYGTDAVHAVFERFAL